MTLKSIEFCGAIYFITTCLLYQDKALTIASTAAPSPKYAPPIAPEPDLWRCRGGNVDHRTKDGPRWLKFSMVWASVCLRGADRKACSSLNHSATSANASGRVVKREKKRKGFIAIPCYTRLGFPDIATGSSCSPSPFLRTSYAYFPLLRPRLIYFNHSAA